MKLTRTLLINCFFVLSVFLMVPGCNGDKGPHGGGGGNGGSPVTPAQRWQEWVNLQETIGREVVGVEASRRWIQQNRDAISVPPGMDFLKQHPVMAADFVIHGVIITVDHNGNHRVTAREWPLPRKPTGVDQLEKWGYTVLTVEASRTWLKQNSYRYEVNNGGYTITRNYSRPGFTDNSTISLSGSGMVSLSSGDAVAIDENGKLRVGIKQ